MPSPCLHYKSHATATRRRNDQIEINIPSTIPFGFLCALLLCVAALLLRSFVRRHRRTHTDTLARPTRKSFCECISLLLLSSGCRCCCHRSSSVSPNGIFWQNHVVHRLTRQHKKDTKNANHKWNAIVLCYTFRVSSEYTSTRHTICREGHIHARFCVCPFVRFVMSAHSNTHIQRTSECRLFIFICHKILSNRRRTK